MSDSNRFCSDKEPCSHNGPFTTYGPDVTPLFPRRGWEMFKLWIVLIIIILVTWSLIYLSNSPLSEHDLIKYVNVDTYTINDSGRTINRSMSPAELRTINLDFIPNLTDYSESITR
jgi:hypothetical protein